mmetsp:Transcript_66579/g.177093  ORF Transcript_66579/g.177093 Transcript_66579/m.177093 type:complete len:213 (+) Transcript_66579:430-1068(+)
MRWHWRRARAPRRQPLLAALQASTVGRPRCRFVAVAARPAYRQAHRRSGCLLEPARCCEQRPRERGRARRLHGQLLPRQSCCLRRGWRGRRECARSAAASCRARPDPAARAWPAAAQRAAWLARLAMQALGVELGEETPENGAAQSWKQQRLAGSRRAQQRPRAAAGTGHNCPLHSTRLPPAVRQQRCAPRRSYHGCSPRRRSTTCTSRGQQ